MLKFSMMTLLCQSVSSIHLQSKYTPTTENLVIGRRPALVGSVSVLAQILASQQPVEASEISIDPTQSWIKETADGSWTLHKGSFNDFFFKDFKTTETGFAYKIINEGDGVKPVQSQSVTVHYTGYLMNGEKFDSSYDKDKPFRFRLGKGKVILGWESVVGGMSKGMRVIVKVPAKYAYGDKGAGSAVPPNSDLVFFMELVRLGSIKD